MAETPTTATPTAWHHLMSLRDDLIHSNDPDHDEQLAAVEERLLGLAAPDLAGVVIKLQLLWDGQLHGQDQDSARKLAVLADLNRLAA